MRRITHLMVFLILSGMCLMWFVFSDPQIGFLDRKHSQVLSGAPQITHQATTRTVAASRETVGLSLSNGKADTSQATSPVTVKAGLLSVMLDEQPLRWVLDEISRQTGILFETGPEINEQRVTDAFQDIPIERGLRRLLRSWDLFFFYEGEQVQPQTIWVYQQGKGVGLRPVPPEVWASTQELELAFNDIDPEIRSKALQALVERKGKSASSLLNMALEDSDDQVRLGALTAANNSSLEIAPDTLIRIVQNDPSPRVRFLALSLLSNNVENPPVNLDILGIANYALDDADPEIRQLASNLINLIEAKTLLSSKK